jgi:hypothetical protein
MKTKKTIKNLIMKVTAFVILLVVSQTSCNLLNSDIDSEKVNVDNSTSVFTFKEDGKKVTGTVVCYAIDPSTGKKYKESIGEVKDGKRIKRGLNYYPNGSINAEYSYDENGLVTGTGKVYYPNGQLYSTTEFKADKKSGISKEYNDDGKQLKEIVYNSGNKTKEYDFDESGKKIIPAIERLELGTYKTGFFEYIDYNSNQLLYQPMVIMKWKNKSDQAITETIEMEGIFINNSKEEEMAKASDFFQGYSDAPLQPNLSRQCVLQSSVGYTNASGIYGANISCQIIINKQLFKTVKIENNFLTTNRIQ